MSKNTKIKGVVEELLTVDPKTRDDDPYLYISVLRTLGVSDTSVYYVLKTVSYQTVRATRQNLQMKYPDLRGKSYKERQRYSRVKRKEYSPSFWDKIQLIFG